MSRDPGRPITTDADIRSAIHRLRALHQRIDGPRYVLPEGTVLRLDHVERKLIDALRRDNGPAPDHDGWPPGGNNSTRGGGPTIVVENEHGQDESVTVTGVEAVAFARIDHGQPHDPHHADTETALNALRAMDDAWITLTRALDSIDNQQRTHRHTNPGGECIICGRWVEGTDNDRLRRGMCPAHHRAWTRAGRPELEWYLVDPDAPPDRRTERARWLSPPHEAA